MNCLVESTRDDSSDPDLEALAEIVPELKSKRSGSGHAMTVDVTPEAKLDVKIAAQLISPTMACVAEETPIEVEADLDQMLQDKEDALKRASTKAHATVGPARLGSIVKANDLLYMNESMKVQESADELEESDVFEQNRVGPMSVQKAISAINYEHDDDQNLGGFDDVGSEHALNSDEGIPPARMPSATEEFQNQMSSAASLSTATQTQTHEVRIPLYLPTFRPATGCTNASDFIVRCFVARLRSGITVVKHGRSRWCKSRLRILHIHPDGRSLSWKPAVGEPTSSKRPPKLDLSTCTEVRHAWSPDPLNTMFTGTPILRQKCEAANAHKSFALIFPKRTVDITAVTADQCKVLMEGFSALCFRLQVANLAGRGGKKGKNPIGEEEVASTTASNTLTNNSTSFSPVGGSAANRGMHKAISSTRS